MEYAMRTEQSPTRTGASQPQRGTDTVVETDIPARLDRLPWARFHTRVVVALGVTWIFDGLEVTLTGAVSGALKRSPALELTNSDVGVAASAYLAGAVLGALFFGWLTDRLGRKRLFFTTLSVYLIASAATAFSWNRASFFAFRFFTGAGIGGEYTAINSTIQELVPARYRGWTDLMINGSFWIGAAIGAIGSIVLLDPAVLEPELGWRLAFLIGAVLGVVIFVTRLWIPESPRWLVTHHGDAEGQAVMAGIEKEVFGATPATEDLPTIRLHVRRFTPLLEVITTLFVVYRGRTIVGLILMASQAFFYNAIFFTYALVLTDFYAVPAAEVGWYILPFAVANTLGPVVLGRFFDTLGRKVMIAFTYAASGVLLAISGWLFARGAFSAVDHTIAWMIVFFFGSAAASSAYLTVSEVFPIEVRALAIAFFYAIGTGIGGVAGPWLLGGVIDTGSRAMVFDVYLLGSAMMVVAAVIAALFCVPAERKSLESVAQPLALVE
jgi:MFS family permease